MQNQAFLPSVPSSLSTITTLVRIDSECNSPTREPLISDSPVNDLLVSFEEDTSSATRFYIGDDSTSQATTAPLVMIDLQENQIQQNNKEKMAAAFQLEESHDETFSAAAALMCESTQRMACQNSFDSGYGIIGYGITSNNKNNRNKHQQSRFITCDSEAAIVLNPEVVITGSTGSYGSGSGCGGHDSGCEDESLASTSGSFTNGTFGKIRVASVVMQVCLAISLSSAGNFGAGIILDNVQNWIVFHRVPELFYLVPALLGLKGNLEMTMVARLSTLANMGRLNTWKRTMRCMAINISLVQCQAIVISFLASSVTFLASIYENNGQSPSEVLPGHMILQPVTSATLGSQLENLTAPVWIETPDNGATLDVTADIYSKVLIIFSTSLATANLACLGSSVFMILMIVLLTNLKINPDNFATAIAASIGDIVTSYLLGVIGQYIYNKTVYLPDSGVTDLSVRFYQDLRSPYIAIAVIVFFVIIFPALAYVTCKDEANKKVLFGTGAWCPILIAMMVSFLSGAFLRIGAKYFAFMALFQPLINGVGGNLAAITTSRLSTEMHVQSNSRTESVNGGHKVSRKSIPRTISDTIKSFLKSKDKQNTLMIIFVVIAIVIQLVYGMLLPIQNGHFGDISYLFYLLYCLAASLQVLILLVLTRFLVNIFWYGGMDPDTCAIPLLTSLGDLLGTVFLLSVFYFLRAMGDISAMPAETSEASLVSSAMAANIDPEAVKGVIYATLTSITTNTTPLPEVTGDVISSTVATLLQTTVNLVTQ